MKKLKKRLLRGALSLFLLVGCIVAGSPAANAAETVEDVPYTNYTYWETDTGRNAVPTKAAFQAYDTISGEEYSIGAFNELQHMCVYDGLLYVLDGANGRIVVLDKEYKLVEQITAISFQGQRLTFAGAQGLFVDETGLYIADTLNKRVICSKNGVAFQVITKPDDTTIPEKFNFAPTRLIRDSSGYFYLLCEGSYYGMMVFTKEYEFAGFFGANNVTKSFGTAIKEAIAGLFDTEEKHASSVQTLPYTMLDVCLDADGFIVTINDQSQGQIRRYGLAGTNILKRLDGYSYVSTDSYNFADTQIAYRDKTTQYGGYVYSAFNAITSDADGFYYVVDGTRGRIFIYDTDANCISVFGGGLNRGDQLGTFVTPSAITVFGDDLLVSDFYTGKITVFRKTEYGKLLLLADSLTVDSHYESAKSYWEKVIEQDKNCQLAYKGLAKAALEEGDYQTALSLSKLAYDRTTYSKVYENVRNAFIQDNFWWIMLVSIAGIAAIVAFIIISRRKAVVLVKNRKLNLALSVTLHPIASLNELKQKKQFSMPIAVVFMALFYISSVLKSVYGGFMFTKDVGSNYNALIEMVGTVGIVLLWTVSNWLCCSLFQGRGDMKEIFCASCYALLPVIVFNFAYLVLSYVLIPSANSGFDLINEICYGLMIIYLLLGITIVHDFSFFKSIAMAILILLGMFVVAFVIFVMLSLSQNVVNFIVQIFNEVTMR